jgi:hypothetical protein
MTREEHLLTILSEECAEVSQRAAKALRFGLFETQEGKEDDNSVRLREEIEDLLGVIRILRDEGLITEPSHDRILAKKPRIEKFLEHSREMGKY